MGWSNGSLTNVSGVVSWYSDPGNWDCPDEALGGSTVSGIEIKDFSLQYWYCDECGKESWTLLEGSWDDAEKSKVALMEAGFLYNAAKWGGIGDVDELHPHKCEGG